MPVTSCDSTDRVKPLDKRRVLLSWSSGKDSAWCLHVLNRQANIEVVGLLTTFNESADRVAMHAVRRRLVELQAESVGLPLITVLLPWPCSNESYEKEMQTALHQARTELDFQAVAFGDLFLEDIRSYREVQLAVWGVDPLFPIWNMPTDELSKEMVTSGLNAFLICVDPRQCPKQFAGRRYDLELLDELPKTVDPCGENGEFHTFAFDGPMFDTAIEVAVGETVERDGFIFTDVFPKSP